MLGVFTSVVTHSDFRFIVLAMAVCFVAGVCTFHMRARMRHSTGWVRTAWIVMAGLEAGAGLWAAHLLALIGYVPGVPSNMEPAGTMTSLFIGLLGVCLSLGLAWSGRGRVRLTAGGAALGVAISVMHYVGVGACRMQGTTLWNPVLVALSIAAAALLATAGLHAGLSGKSFRRQIVGAGLLTLAVMAVHFIGAAALTIHPDATLPVPPHIIDDGAMAVGVLLLVSLVIVGGLSAAFVDDQASRAGLLRMRRLADAAREGIVVVSGSKITDANAAFCALAGAPVEALLGRDVGDLLLWEEDPEGAGRDVTPGPAHLHPVEAAPAIPVEAERRTLVAGDQVIGAGLSVISVRDLRDRHAAQERIRFLAEHDALTGLPNRHALQTRLEAARQRVDASGETLAVICVDLDHFKVVNDMHGHAAGDALLVEVARRLEALAPAPSFAARLGGDEFMIVRIAPTGENADETAADVARHAGALLEALQTPLVYEGQSLDAGASLGVSLYPEDGADGAALIANADMALYRAKEGGRGAFCFFKREMDDSVRERRNLSRELRLGIEREELVVHYQPQARTSDGKLCGFEALVRWRHPERGLLGPDRFIPIAEESGLIGPLGEWVLRRACADAATWSDPVSVAVNLSPLQVSQAGLPAVVHQVLIDSGLNPRRLELEITESALFRDYQRALDNLRRLKALGVRIAMDDFGTGFSSLSTLQSFPFDKIKIDKSFVEGLGRQDRATVIVRAVLGIGRGLDIPVVAEGVETLAQLEFLRNEACAEVQGYHIGRPAPLESCEILMNMNARAVAAA